MKISASIYSFKNKQLPSLVRELDDHNIDMFHIDCMDDVSVFEDIARIRKYSNTPIDLHVISSEPKKFLPLIDEHNIEYATFQYENLIDGIDFPSGSKTNFGLSIVSETDIDVFEKYRDKVSFILLMCSTPGQSGLGFNKENLRKIRQFAQKYPGVKIHVDGGVTPEISFILRNMGVYAAVSGSYLFKASYLGAALLNLKNEEPGSHFLIKDFMLGMDETPILRPNEHSLEKVLRSIDEYKLGFTILADNSGRLDGIITNADIRRGLIRHVENLNELDVENIINRNPVAANQGMTIMEMLKFIKKQRFPIIYMPVVDNNNKVVGAVTFNNLIKGEL